MRFRPSPAAVEPCTWRFGRAARGSDSIVVCMARCVRPAERRGPRRGVDGARRKGWRWDRWQGRAGSGKARASAKRGASACASPQGVVTGADVIGRVRQELCHGVWTRNGEGTVQGRVTGPRKGATGPVLARSAGRREPRGQDPWTCTGYGACGGRGAVERTSVRRPAPVSRWTVQGSLGCPLRCPALDPWVVHLRRVLRGHAGPCARVAASVRGIGAADVDTFASARG